MISFEVEELIQKPYSLPVSYAKKDSKYIELQVPNNETFFVQIRRPGSMGTFAVMKETNEQSKNVVRVYCKYISGKYSVLKSIKSYNKGGTDFLELEAKTLSYTNISILFVTSAKYDDCNITYSPTSLIDSSCADVVLGVIE